MKYADIFIDTFENTSNEPVYIHGTMRLNPGARVISGCETPSDGSST